MLFHLRVLLTFWPGRQEMQSEQNGIEVASIAFEYVRVHPVLFD